jgi:hypothetical protein
VAVTNGYTDVIALREHLGDTRSDVLNEKLLERAIDAASRAIDDFTGRRFWADPSPVVRTYRPRLVDQVYVHDFASTTGLVVKTDDTGTGVFGTTWTIGTDFQVEPLGADEDSAAWTGLGAIGTREFTVTTSRRPLLQVTAAYGWPAVPKAIEEACVLKAASLFQRKDSPQGVAGFGDFGVVRISRRDPHVMELLEGYVRISRPDR